MGDVLVYNLQVIWLTLSISSWYVSMVLNCLKGFKLLIPNVVLTSSLFCGLESTKLWRVEQKTLLTAVARDIMYTLSIK